LPDWLTTVGATWWIVAAAAFLTAVTTGVGALPFLFVRHVGTRLMGHANAAAGGLMLAASFSLVMEGTAEGMALTLAGLAAGLLAIVTAKRLLPEEGHSVAHLQGGDAVKALLILGVMTAHSFAEGVGVGVSFGGREGLGAFITFAIALHNVPEGLAIALVLVPRGTPVWQAAGWAVFTSLPQPLMAVPAFLFVSVFQPVLPFGLGFAAGAMIWMVIAELLPDAFDDARAESSAVTATAAFIALLGIQSLFAPH
jgi:zinc transporter ZupT